MPDPALFRLTTFADPTETRLEIPPMGFAVKDFGITDWEWMEISFVLSATNVNEADGLIDGSYTFNETTSIPFGRPFFGLYDMDLGNIYGSAFVGSRTPSTLSGLTNFSGFRTYTTPNFVYCMRYIPANTDGKMTPSTSVFTTTSIVINYPLIIGAHTSGGDYYSNLINWRLRYEVLNKGASNQQLRTLIYASPGVDSASIADPTLTAISSRYTDSFRDWNDSTSALPLPNAFCWFNRWPDMWQRFHVIGVRTGV